MFVLCIMVCVSVSFRWIVYNYSTSCYFRSSTMISISLSYFCLFSSLWFIHFLFSLCFCHYLWEKEDTCSPRTSFHKTIQPQFHMPDISLILVWNVFVLDCFMERNSDGWCLQMTALKWMWNDLPAFRSNFYVFDLDVDWISLYILFDRSRFHKLINSRSYINLISDLCQIDVGLVLE